MGSFASGECCAPPQLNHTDDWNGYADDVSWPWSQLKDCRAEHTR
jgi:hypothetical protein